MASHAMTLRSARSSDLSDDETTFVPETTNVWAQEESTQPAAHIPVNEFEIDWTRFEEVCAEDQAELQAIPDLEDVGIDWSRLRRAMKTSRIESGIPTSSKLSPPTSPSRPPGLSTIRADGSPTTFHSMNESSTTRASRQTMDGNIPTSTKQSPPTSPTRPPGLSTIHSDGTRRFREENYDSSFNEQETESTVLEASTLVELAEALEETAVAVSENEIATTGMTALGERMLDFAIRGTKRAGSDLGSGPPSKKYHVTPVAPPKPARIRHAPQTVESSPVKSPPRPVSPAKAKSSKPSWYTKTAAMKEADSKNDLQIQVNGKAGELGKPTRFFRKNYVILSHPENLIQAPASAKRHQRACVNIENNARIYEHNWHEFVSEIEKGNVGAMMFVAGPEKTQIYRFGDIDFTYVSR
ncbi:unnamed protein product [Oikopleura dioica]|uniref:Uncharacterized protein n=2 Tax=Oikopleura dioica TaxID=34765 RepID=E4XYF2_OIKDI|nr:unnamed protein product [Oikopleura dioica]CBY40571.1 unnamed protein product [Oikopleura dioica]